MKRKQAGHLTAEQYDEWWTLGFVSAQVPSDNEISSAPQDIIPALTAGLFDNQDLDPDAVSAAAIEDAVRGMDRSRPFAYLSEKGWRDLIADNMTFARTDTAALSREEVQQVAGELIASLQISLQAAGQDGNCGLF